MGAFKTYCAVIAALGLSLTAVQAPAQTVPRSPAEQVRLFATCAGRLSALMEHQWLVDGPASERTEELRDGFTALIDATLPDARAYGLPAPYAMHWRLTEKAAQAALLQTAQFGTDPMMAARSAAAAEARVAECTALLTG